jgi:HlyD family secretion protein
VKNKGKRAAGFLLLAAVLAGALWFFMRGRGNPKKPEQALARVARHDFASTVLATGAIRPQVGAEVKVGARISGRVEKLHVNIGDTVTKGQVLAELEKTELQAQVALCQAALAEAQSRLSAIKRQRPEEIGRAQAVLDEAKAARQLAELDWQRTREAQAKGAATPHELDAARTELDTAAARVSLAEAELRLAEVRFPDDVKTAGAMVASRHASVASAKARLAYATIPAPISGVVASVSTQEGETVAAGLNAPTFVTIIDLSRLQVDAYVDEVDIGKVRLGQRAVFTVDTFPGREFEGKVTAIYPKENVVNYDVVINIGSPYGGLLRPEMTASVTILMEARRDVLAVPTKAVKRHRGKTVAYVLEDGRAEACEIKVGWKDGWWIEVVSGLEEGQTVLLDAPEGEQNQH